MRKILVFFLVLTVFSSFVYSNSEYAKSNIFVEIIEKETEAIAAARNSKDLSERYSERGISLLFSGEYENSLSDFNAAIEEQIKSGNLDEAIIGCALWGRLLANAYLDRLDEVVLDIESITSLMQIDTPCDCNPNCDTNLHYSDYILRTEVWPENRPMSRWDCEKTVENTAQAMRCLATLAPKSEVRFLLMELIDKLAKKAKECCAAGGLWSACLKPMAEKLHLWNQKYRFFGIPPNPAWD